MGKVDETYYGLMLRLPSWIMEPSLVTNHAKADSSPRHYAYYSPNSNTIYTAPKLAHTDNVLVKGILAHELGHALAYSLSDAGRLVIPSDYDECERQADALAERYLHLRIYYDESDLVQRAGRGAHGYRPRPDGVR